MPEPGRFDVFLVYSNKDEVEAREIAVALQDRGLSVWLDLWRVTPDDLRRDRAPEGLKADAVAILLGSDGFKLESEPRMFGFLSEWIKRGEPLVPVLLPGAPDSSLSPFLLHDRLWVDFQDGMTNEGLDLLATWLTRKNPSRRPSPPLTPEELLHLAFRLVVARRAGTDLLLHLDAARLREAMEGVLDESSRIASLPRLRLRAVATWLAEQFPEALPDPLWQKWMLATQGKALEDLADALASTLASSAPPA
jgi:hypothetical protein